jgi:hypothetical protein
MKKTLLVLLIYITLFLLAGRTDNQGGPTTGAVGGGAGTDTNAGTECAGATTYLNGEAACVDIDPVYENELNDSAGLIAALDDEVGDTFALFSNDPTVTGTFVYDGVTDLTISARGIHTTWHSIELGSTFNFTDILAFNIGQFALEVKVGGLATWNFGGMFVTGDQGFQIPEPTLRGGAPSYNGLSAAKQKGMHFYGDLSTGDMTINLKVAAINMRICMMDNEENGHTLIIHPFTGDTIQLPGGPPLAANNKVSNSTNPTQGDYICLVSKLGTTWTVDDFLGTWLDVGP